jgi:hypothetical protein
MYLPLLWALTRPSSCCIVVVVRMNLDSVFVSVSRLFLTWHVSRRVHRRWDDHDYGYAEQVFVLDGRCQSLNRLRRKMKNSRRRMTLQILEVDGIYSILRINTVKRE